MVGATGVSWWFLRAHPFLALSGTAAGLLYRFAPRSFSGIVLVLAGWLFFVMLTEHLALTFAAFALGVVSHGLADPQSKSRLAKATQRLLPSLSNAIEYVTEEVLVKGVEASLPAGGTAGAAPAGRGGGMMERVSGSEPVSSPPRAASKPTVMGQGQVTGEHAGAGQQEYGRKSEARSTEEEREGEGEEEDSHPPFPTIGANVSGTSSSVGRERERDEQGRQSDATTSRASSPRVSKGTEKGPNAMEPEEGEKEHEVEAQARAQ